ncbi:hypothetical protein BD779DRAFT_1432396 [Infundibulicybe gibba]|nr:hypothetical protein BD779DRAFT_1432396 [Infundibulicybe gibba]
MKKDIAEAPAPQRSRTFSFYLVLFTLVVPLWSSVPLSWLFVLHTLYTKRLYFFAWSGRFLFALAVAEVLFSLHHYRLAKRVAPPSPCGPGELAEINAAYTRLLKAGLANFSGDGRDEESMNGERPGSPAEPIVQLDHDDPRAVDFRNSLRTWFCKVPWSSVRLHEIRKWLYWSIFNTELPPLDKLPSAHRVVLDEALDLLQKRSGSIITDGSNPAIQPMRLTIDHVNIHWRPLTFYVIIGCLNRGLRKLYEVKWKARYSSHDGLEYLIRTPVNWKASSDLRPIVFIHGLGLGLIQYNVVITHLLETFPDRPLLILLQPHISQDVFHPAYLRPMTRHETADRLAALMTELGWVVAEGLNDSESSESSSEQANSKLGSTKKGVTMMSHSNGSYAHGWMLKGYPNMISRSCFVDPVTFCSWEGDVCYNFIYRPCKTGIELLMRYFVGSELGVANLLQRHFDWASNSLWYEEIPNARDPSKTFFLLGGKDDIVNCERVKRYLSSHGIRKNLWIDPNGRHGQALIIGGPGHTEILRWLHES